MADTAPDTNTEKDEELERLRRDVKAQCTLIERYRALNPPPPQRAFPRLHKFSAAMQTRGTLDKVLRLLFCLCKGLGHGPLKARYGEDHWAPEALVSWSAQIDTTRAVMDLTLGASGVDTVLNGTPEADPVLRFATLLSALGCVAANVIQAVYHGFAVAPAAAAKRLGVTTEKWGRYSVGMWVYFLVLELLRDIHRMRRLTARRARLLRQAGVPKEDLAALGAQLSDLRLLIVKNVVDFSLATGLLGWHRLYTPSRAGFVGLIPTAISLLRVYRDS